MRGTSAAAVGDPVPTVSRLHHSLRVTGSTMSRLMSIATRAAGEPGDGAVLAIIRTARSDAGTS